MENKLEFYLPGWLTQVLRKIELEETLWLVGGAVRDALLLRECKDFDFVCSSGGRRLARRLANLLGAPYFSLDEERDTGRVLYQDEAGQTWCLDVTSLRGKSLKDDLLERDFTINALAVDVSADTAIIDTLGGQQDLREKVLRPCSAASLENDPVRVLRAIRIAANLGFRIHQDTLEQISRTTDQLAVVSSERIRDELFHILSLENPVRALRILQHLEVLSHLMAQIIPVRRNGRAESEESLLLDFKWISSFSTIENLVKTRDGDRANANLVAGILFNVLKPFRQDLDKYLSNCISADRPVKTLSILYQLFTLFVKHQGDESLFTPLSSARSRLVEDACSNLRLSRAETSFIISIPLLDFSNSIDKDIPLLVHRLVRSSGEAAAAGILISLAGWLSDGTAGQKEFDVNVIETIQKVLHLIFHDPELIHPEPVMDGGRIMESLDISAGPQVGHLLQLVGEAQVTGIVKTEQDALDFLGSLKEKKKLRSIEDTPQYQSMQRL